MDYNKNTTTQGIKSLVSQVESSKSYISLKMSETLTATNESESEEVVHENPLKRAKVEVVPEESYLEKQRKRIANILAIKQKVIQFIIVIFKSIYHSKSRPTQH